MSGKGCIRSKKEEKPISTAVEMMLSQAALNILLPFIMTGIFAPAILSLLSNLQKDSDKRCLGCGSFKDTLTEFKPAFQGRGIEIHWSSEYAFYF